MAKQKWKPDMVIGVDFGMTCTGVSWTMGPEWADPKTVQHWPGTLAHELRNKVDTAVSYDTITGKLVAWGFQVDRDDQHNDVNELFKLSLDPSYKDTTGTAPSLREVRTWFRDYLSCLYGYIKQNFRRSMPRFEQKKVEYVFSVPTTWTDPAMLAETEGMIRAAGFGQAHNERASIYLTEAEAAAIYTSKQALEVDDVFLVCDIGGGTTDLNVLKVQDTTVGKMNLIPLSHTEGMAVGSTLIDFQMLLNISERLRRIRPPLPGDMEVIAEKMLQTRFLSFKCSFGNDAFRVVDLYMPVPGLSQDQDFPDSSIWKGKMVLKIDELRVVFDEQIDKLLGQIDQQLQIVQSKHPKEMIQYIVLSGGLGSSSYVQQKIKARYEDRSGGGFKNAKGIQVLVANEPQLAVCHGLVMARAQECRSGKEVLTKRCSPASYGIVCREPYDPDKHWAQVVVRDESDKSRWAIDQIVWIMRKGDLFDTSIGAKQTYQLRLEPGEEKVPWKARIAMSTLPLDRLPQSISEKGARTVCEIEYQLGPKDLTFKNQRWYHLKKPYLLGIFEVRIIVGTGLRFEICSKDRVLSRDHEEIKVEWVPPGHIP